MIVEIAATIDAIQEKQECKYDIPEIRVWIHPKNGDDYFLSFDTWTDALKVIKNVSGAEETPVIAYKGFEIDISQISNLRDISRRKK